MDVVQDEPQEFLPTFDAMCVNLGNFPRHTLEKYDIMRAAAEAAIDRIGAGARADEHAEEFEKLRVVEGSTVEPPMETLEVDPPTELLELTVDPPTEILQVEPPTELLPVVTARKELEDDPDDVSADGEPSH